MLIARVIGELVATYKHPSHEGLKILMVQPLNLDAPTAVSLWWRSTRWTRASATRCWWSPRVSAHAPPWAGFYNPLTWR